jgi:serine/threonine protein kinase
VQLGTETFALKYIPKPANEIKLLEFGKSPTELAETEAKIMQTLNHPSIAKVHKYFKLYDNTQQEIALCIVMDFIDGENLRQVLHNSREPYPRARVMEWFIKILEVYK